MSELRNFVDEIAERHQRTSCTDEDSNGNEYFNEYGYPRCIRCAILYRLKNKQWPRGASPRVETLILRIER